MKFAICDQEQSEPAGEIMNKRYKARSLREIIGVLFRHGFAILLIVAVGTGGTWAYCRFLAPQSYRSRVNLIFERSPIENEDLREMAQKNLSDLVLARAKIISENKTLREEWYRLRTQRDSARANRKKSTKRIEKRINAFLADGDVADGVRTLLLQQDGLDEFRDSIELKPLSESAAMALIVERPGEREQRDSHRNAMHAADVLADMYIAAHQEHGLAAAAQLEQAANREPSQPDRGAQEKVEAFRRFVTDHRGEIAVFEQMLKGETSHDFNAILTKARDSEAALQIELAHDKALCESVKGSLPAEAMKNKGSATMSDSEVADTIAAVPTDLLNENVVVLELNRHLAKLEVERTGLEAHFTEASHEWRRINEQINKSRRQLLNAIIAQVGSLETSVKTRERQLAVNQQLIRRHTAEQKRINGKLAEYSRLKNEFEVARAQLEGVGQETSHPRPNVVPAGEAVAISRLGSATTPDPNQPSSPSTKLYSAIAFAVSFMLGAMLAFYLERFDNTLRSSTDAERHLDLPVLGLVRKHGDRLVTSTYSPATTGSVLRV
ncbi:MAG: hypothetical protein MI923_10490 [Phycisphaerales bacterium]|nr:hypothetical protein [Phycisphaerales bacterium]